MIKYSEHSEKEYVIYMVTFEEDMEGCFHPTVDTETEYEYMEEDGKSVYSVTIDPNDCNQLEQYMEIAPCVSSYEKRWG